LISYQISAGESEGLAQLKRLLSGFAPSRATDGNKASAHFSQQVCLSGTFLQVTVAATVCDENRDRFSSRILFEQQQQVHMSSTTGVSPTFDHYTSLFIASFDHLCVNNAKNSTAFCTI